jgi:tetratricopeptide (TPR) repeat protein
MTKSLFLLLALASPLLSATADELLARAVSLAKANQLEEAENVLLEGRRTFPHDPRLPIELAGIAWRRKSPARAKTFLRQGLSLDPSNAYANEFLGSVYLLDGNVYAALEYFNRLRRPVIAGVAFNPPAPLHPALRERLSAVSSGQLLTPARLSETEHNLRRLRIFSEPRFELAPAQNSEYDFTVRAPALSQPLTGTLGRLLPLLRGLPYQNVSLDWLNLRQRAISLTSLWRWDPDKRRIAVNYRVPSANSAYSIYTDLRDEDWVVTSNQAVNVRSAALGGQVEYELGGGRQWTPGIHLSRHLFRGGDGQPLFTNATIWEIRNRLDLPRWRYTERRLTVDSSLTARAGRIYSRSSSKMLGADFDAALHWLPQQKDDLYQIHGRLRAAALSGGLPVDALYITAMERDNDVWLRGHVGTRNGRKGNAPMGTRYAIAQTGVMRRLWRMPFVRLDAGPFFDVGNVGGKEGLGSRGWLYDTGVQADVTLLGGFRLSVVYGRDLRTGTNVFYASAILR